MSKEDYVSFETVKLLRKKMPSDYFNHLIKEKTEDSAFRKYYSCSLYMAMKWLREAHKIDIDIISRLSLNADDDHCYSYIIKHQYDKYHYKTYTDGEYLKFEEACDAAIKYVLENLV